MQQLATGLLRSGDNATNFTRYSGLAQQRDALWVNSASGSGPMLPAKGDRRFARITAGVNLGVGEGKTDTQKTLSDALAGMDDALLTVVEANKVAPQKLTDGGASFEESSVKKGLKELETFEEKFLDGIGKLSKALATRLKNNGNQS
jgi:hypothetical protein